MSTRSLIGMVQHDGTVKFIYCHSDGYLSWNGVRLHQHYQDVLKVQQLIDLKDISTLGTEIGEKHDFNASMIVYSEHGLKEDLWPDAVKQKMARITPFCRAYERDRGEKTEVRTCHSAQAFWRQTAGTEYWYLYEDRSWFMKNLARAPMLLSDALTDELKTADA